MILVRTDHSCLRSVVSWLCMGVRRVTVGFFVS
jgi:hypothetical protein